MFQRGWFLVDVPDTDLADTVVDVVQRYGVVRALRADAAQATTALLAEPGRVAGMIIQVGEEAVARLREVRAQVPCLPVLALFGSRSDPPASTFGRGRTRPLRRLARGAAHRFDVWSRRSSPSLELGADQHFPTARHRAGTVAGAFAQRGHASFSAL